MNNLLELLRRYLGMESGAESGPGARATVPEVPYENRMGETPIFHTVSALSRSRETNKPPPPVELPENMAQAGEPPRDFNAAVKWARANNKQLGRFTENGPWTEMEPAEPYGVYAPDYTPERAQRAGRLKALAMPPPDQRTMSGLEYNAARRETAADKGWALAEMPENQDPTIPELLAMGKDTMGGFGRMTRDLLKAEIEAMMARSRAGLNTARVSRLTGQEVRDAELLESEKKRRQAQADYYRNRELREKVKFSDQGLWARLNSVERQIAVKEQLRAQAGTRAEREALDDEIADLQMQSNQLLEQMEPGKRIERANAVDLEGLQGSTVTERARPAMGREEKKQALIAQGMTPEDAEARIKAFEARNGM